MEQRWIVQNHAQHTLQHGVCSFQYLYSGGGVFSVIPSLYNNVTGAKTGLDLAAIDSATMSTITPNTTAMGVCAILALAANVVCLSVIIKRAIEQKKNPYKRRNLCRNKTSLKQWKSRNKDIKISIKKWAESEMASLFYPIMHIFLQFAISIFLFE